MAITIVHMFKTKWYPIDDTEEEIIDFFQRDPLNGRKLSHQKIRPNRNWCYFEQCSNIVSSNVTIVQTQMSWMFSIQRKSFEYNQFRFK
jgi:hypothetical protein